MLVLIVLGPIIGFKVFIGFLSSNKSNLQFRTLLVDKTKIPLRMDFN